MFITSTPPFLSTTLALTLLTTALCVHAAQPAKPPAAALPAVTLPAVATAGLELLAGPATTLRKNDKGILTYDGIHLSAQGNALAANLVAKGIAQACTGRK